MHTTTTSMHTTTPSSEVSISHDDPYYNINDLSLSHQSPKQPIIDATVSTPFVTSPNVELLLLHYYYSPTGSGICGNTWTDRRITPLAKGWMKMYQRETGLHPCTGLHP